MSSLKAINNTLQEQTKVQEQTSTNIADLRDRIADMLSLEENRRGDELEKRIEEKQQKQKIMGKTVTPAKSFRQGFAEGTGLSGLGQILKDMLGAIGLGGGLLGGMTLGGLFGRAVGRLFFPAIGAFFGVEYLDKWLDPLVDKITGDDATWTMFGKEVDASKIVSGLAGAMAVIFGKDAIIQTAKGLLGVGDKTKVGNLRKLFVRRLGLSAALVGIGGLLGDIIADYTGNVKAGEITETLVDGLSIAMLFVPGGFLMRAIAGFAIGGALLIRDYLRERAEKSKAEFMAEVEQFADEQELHKKSDAALIAKAEEVAKSAGQKSYYGRGGDGVEEEAYIQEMKRRSEKLHEMSLLEEEIAFLLEELKNQIRMNPNGFADITPLANALAEYKDIVGVNHPAAKELESIRSQILSNKISQVAAEIKPVAPAVVETPRPTVTTVDVGATYSPGVIPKPGTAGFSLTDMFGTGNSFTNAPPSNFVDASQQTTIQNVQSQKVQLSDNFPAAVDNHYARQYMGIPGFGFTIGTTF